MKPLFSLAIAALSTVLVSACHAWVDIDNPALDNERQIVFSASREGFSPGTKTMLFDNGEVWWNKEEEISVFYGSGSMGGSKFISQNTTLEKTVDFAGTISMSGASKDFWAVYPYSDENACDGYSITTVIPSEQKGVEGNFSNDVFPAIAKSGSLDLAFWNICGGIKFFVSRDDIKSVTFRGNNGETLAGKVRVTFDASGVPAVTEVLDGKQEITLRAPDGGCFKAGKYYYISLLPVGLDGGFTLSFRAETAKGSVISNNPQTIKRSIFGVLKNIDTKVQNWEDALPIPDAVDLGLSVLWATFNVGASAPEEYGNYYAWGETEPKDEYTRDNYIRPTTIEYSSRNSIPTRTVVIYESILSPECDAAHVSYGGKWRMPTRAECEELVEDCSYTQVSVNGIDGYLFTSKINGNSIFLPEAGFKKWDDGVEHGYEPGCGIFYWSSSTKSSPYLIENGEVESYDYTSNSGYPYCGQSVRAVCPNPNPRHVNSVIIDKTEITLYEGRSESIKYSALPETAANRKVVCTSSAPDVASVSWHDDYDDWENYKYAYAHVNALKAGTTTITVTTVDGGLQASCKVTVMPPQEMEAVDLGLSVKWASQNLGSFGPEEYEEYYEIPGTRYYLGITELPAEDDIVRETLGDKWRMPTMAEWEELVDNCTWTWTTVHGVSGRTLTSKINGRSIFIPASGWRDRSSDLDMLQWCGLEGTYWSSTLKPMSRRSVYYLQFDTKGESFDNCRVSDENWRSIRPVYGEFISVSSITLDKNSLDLMVGDSAQLNAAISPSNATAPSVYWESDNKSIVSVDQNGNISAIAEGSTTITAFSSNGLSASCVVTVSEPIPTTGESNGHEWVDLGLSVKWATCNVGAKNPEEYGDYFAWGETEPKSDYSWSTYKWCNGDYNKLTKYCTDSSYWDSTDPMDYKTVLDLEDDAAHVNWGGSWRMPTDDEWTELRTKCTWTWTTQNGVNGRLVTGPNGNSIFLPAAGNRSDSNLYSAGSFGIFWSSSLCADGPGCAWSVGFGSGDVLWDGGSRCDGFSVRPVSE